MECIVVYLLYCTVVNIKILYIHSCCIRTKVTVDPSRQNTIGNKHCVHYSEVSLTKGLLIYFQYIFGWCGTVESGY